MWNGGRYVRFGRPISEERLSKLVRLAYENGIRTFVTSDVYRCGEADDLLGSALKTYPRESYSLVALIGHDFYNGTRGVKEVFPRFTDRSLRCEQDYKGFLHYATKQSLQRCMTDYFDVVMMHNPDHAGYTSDAVWEGMWDLKKLGLAKQLGIAPGPANGFLLDILDSFETYGDIIDWGLVIYNPLEPWPTENILSAAVKNNISLMARVVECGGIFHGDIAPDYKFDGHDHRMHRPRGWLREGLDKVSSINAIVDAYPGTLLQFACLWALSQKGLSSVVPTLIQECGIPVKSIENKLMELAELPHSVQVSREDLVKVDIICNNRSRASKFSQNYKGANLLHSGPDESDRWSINKELAKVANRWGVDLEDLAEYSKSG